MDTVKRYNVVLVSPSDVSADKELVDATVVEVNRLLAKQAIEFKVLRWETDVHPGIGRYTQEVINGQILQDFDLMIALFGARLGTPTLAAPSGTVEEVRRGLENTQSVFGNHRLAVFFKKVFVNPLECDVEQVIALQKFRKELQSKSVLYFEYDDVDELSKSVRLMLVRLTEEVNVHANEANSAENEIVETDSSILDSEFGILDYLELFESNINSSGEHLNRCNEFMTTFATATQSFYEKFNATNNKQSIPEKKHQINEFGYLMDKAASNIKIQIQLTKESLAQALDFGFKAINLKLADFGGSEQEAKDLGRLLDLLADAARLTANEWQAVSILIERIPRLTAPLERFDFRRNHILRL